MIINDSILIGVDFTENKDDSILLVGRKRLNESVEIINAFKGEEAEELYKKLTTSTLLSMEDKEMLMHNRSICEVCGKTSAMTVIVKQTPDGYKNFNVCLDCRREYERDLGKK